MLVTTHLVHAGNPFSAAAPKFVVHSLESALVTLVAMLLTHPRDCDGVGASAYHLALLSVPGCFHKMSFFDLYRGIYYGGIHNIISDL